MRRFAIVALAAVSFISAHAFGQTTRAVSSSPATAASAPVKLRVLCSTFPMYLFTRNVAAGRATAYKWNR